MAIPLTSFSSSPLFCLSSSLALPLNCPLPSTMSINPINAMGKPARKDNPAHMAQSAPMIASRSLLPNMERIPPMMPNIEHINHDQTINTMLGL